jgi:LuxR family maltose regulon positive regulatory protein
VGNDYLLAAKTCMPRLPRDWVERTRLSRLVEEALRSALTLVSAPAGYGKSTLLSETLHDRSSVGWVSLEAGDNSPASFWTYIAAALRETAPQKCDNLLEVLRSPQAPPDGWVLAALLDAIGDSDGLVLVLDDYHRIESRSIHEAVCFLVEHLPPNAHLVIAGRSDPPLPLARWRAKGILAEIRASDLGFTREEAGAFFSAGAGMPLSEKDLETLERKTEGWIVGLKMASLSLRGKADVSAAIDAFSGSNRFILDYLAEEALDRQPPETRRFLLETSIAERLCGPLCDAVTGRADGQSMLARLEAENLFISPLDEERNWYRYHHLFASILGNVLAKEGPEAVNRLHLRAGAWYEESGFIQEAVDHYLNGGAFKRAIDVLEKTAHLMLGQSRANDLMGYGERIPTEYLVHSPWLCITFAWAALMTGAQDILSAMLSTAGQAMQRSPDELSAGSRANMGRIKGHLLSIQSFIAQYQNDLALATGLSEQADKELSGADPGDRLARAVNSLNLAVCYEKAGDISKAIPFFQEMAAAGQTGGFSYAALSALGNLAEMEMILSRLDRAAGLCGQAIELSARWGAGNPLPGAALAHLVRGQLQYERNELDAASESFFAAIRLGKLGAEKEVVLRGCLLMARLEQTRNNTASASEYVRRAESLGPWLIVPADAGRIPAWKAALALRGGDVGSALKWVREREETLMVSQAPDYGQEPEYLTLARIKLASGEYAGLSRGLDGLIGNAERQGRSGTVIEALILKAISQDIEAPGDAVKTLDCALAIGRPAGYLRIFVDEGQALTGLLQKAAEGANAEYARKILALMEAGPRAEPRGPATAPGLIEALSAREMEVLGLITAGKSNKEIASELFLASGTVKKHTSNIFGKLGVDSRTKAVARARELGLL